DAAENHAGSENRLGQSTVLPRERVGNQRLCRGSISRFTDADEGPGKNEQGKCWGEAAGNRGKAPKDDAASDDFWFVEAVGKIAGGNARQSEHDQEHHLQGAELRVAHTEVLPQEGHQRIQHLTVGEVDKIDQSKYSKKARLLVVERDLSWVHLFTVPLARGVTSYGSTRTRFTATDSII